MKVLIIALIVIGVLVLLGVALEIWGSIAYRRWRKWFDSLPPDRRRKEQERLYKAKM